MMKNKAGISRVVVFSQIGNLIKYAFYSIAIVSGAVFFFYLDRLGMVNTLLGGIIKAGTYFYSICGIVSIGLIPLSVGVIVLAIWQMGHHLGLWHFKKHHTRKYELVENIGPILGILGTMLGLVEALRGLDIEKGLQIAIQAMSIGVGQALWSSVFGLLLALFAYILRHSYDSSRKQQEV